MLSDRLTFNSQAAGQNIGPNLFVWGSNASGILGLGDTIARSSPVQLAGTASIGLRADGTLWAWGGFPTGLGDTITRSSPVQVGSASDWIDISGCHQDGGSPSAAALRADGSLWVWGSNNYGQLGVGTAVYVARSSPVQIAGTWKHIGHNESLQFGAIRFDGSLFMWGFNSQGQLGLGDYARRSSPTQVAGTWKQFMCIEPNHPGSTSAIRGDGSLFTWGNNKYGTLGLGDTTSRLSPVQVPGTWNYVAPVGQGAALGLKHDNSLWSWGMGNYLGVGDSITRSSPTQIAGTWVKISGGSLTGLALRPGGSLWTWGVKNDLGIGDTTTSRSSPVQIAGTWTNIFQGRNPALFGMKL